MDRDKICVVTRIGVFPRLILGKSITFIVIHLRSPDWLKNMTDGLSWKSYPPHVT